MARIVKRSHTNSLRKTGEFGLIRKIGKQFPSRDRSVLLGIGDDAAVIKPSPGKVLLMTVDTVREGVHYLSSREDAGSVGWKSLAVSLSDIAAMGGRPRFLLVSLALPPGYSLPKFDRFFQGMKRLLARYSVSLIGGNISRARDFSADTTLVGEADPKSVLRRSGASVGDLIYVTGTLGDSAAGLELLKRGIGSGPLVRRHLRPEPRVQEGIVLAEQRLATAAIDVSDGLLQDLSHLCESSRVGARIHADAIPSSPALRKHGSDLKMGPIDYALSGGEDYELLFTVRPDDREKVEAVGRKKKLRWTRIGEIVRQKQGVTLTVSGAASRRTTVLGYDHFRI